MMLSLSLLVLQLDAEMVLLLWRYLSGKDSGLFASQSLADAQTLLLIAEVHVPSEEPIVLVVFLCMSHQDQA